MIRPGEIWNDTSGGPISARGVGVLFHKGAYGWFGRARIASLPE